MEFKDRLKYLREENNWTKSDTAKKIGVSYSAYSNYEYGNREPNLDMIKKMAKVFNVSSLYLIEGEKTLLDISNEEKDRNNEEILKLLTDTEGNQLENIKKVSSKLDTMLFTSLKNDLIELDLNQLNEDQRHILQNTISIIKNTDRQNIEDKDFLFKLRSFNSSLAALVTMDDFSLEDEMFFSSSAIESIRQLEKLIKSDYFIKKANRK